MNILFVFSHKNGISTGKPLLSQTEMHFGISYISSFLKHHGHQTKLLVITRKTELKFIDNLLEEFEPSLICFTAVFSEYRPIANMAKYIKNRHPKIFLLAGGPHVSLNPEECAEDSFDALCISEGEAATLELVKQLERNDVPSKIHNLWIKHGDVPIEKNSPNPFSHNLDSLPFPDREMWQPWIESIASPYPILLGRGCPFLCTYCCNHALRKTAPGTYVRLRSPENILDEIKEITNKLPNVKEIYLEVETFGVKIDWSIDLCSKLEGFNAKRPQPISFGVNLRVTPNMPLENLFLAMSKSNFKFVNIGLESGSERVRSEILKRHYSNETIIDAVNLAKKYGLKIIFQILIGIPGETIEDFKETIKTTRTCLPDHYALNIFFPYPGTELHQLAREKGLLSESLDTEKERARTVLNLPEFTRKQIQSNYIWFEYNVYKGHRPLLNILDRVLTAKVLSSPIMFRLFNSLLANTFIRNLKNSLKNAMHKNLEKF